MAASSAPRITGTVLVVDDDAEVRESLAAALETDGHRVVMASSAAEAVSSAFAVFCCVRRWDFRGPPVR